MKLLMAIVSDSDVKELGGQMLAGGFSVTKIGSTGGIIKSGMTTLISAVNNESVQKALDIISSCTHSRKYSSSEPVIDSAVYSVPGMGGEISVGGATVFVLNIEESYKF